MVSFLSFVHFLLWDFMGSTLRYQDSLLGSIGIDRHDRYDISLLGTKSKSNIRDLYKNLSNLVVIIVVFFYPSLLCSDLRGVSFSLSLQLFSFPSVSQDPPSQEA